MRKKRRSTEEEEKGLVCVHGYYGLLRGAAVVKAEEHVGVKGPKGPGKPGAAGQRAR